MYKLSLALMALMALTFWSGNVEARVISAFGNQVGQDSVSAEYVVWIIWVSDPSSEF